MEAMHLRCKLCSKSYLPYGTENRGKCHPCYLKYQREYRDGSRHLEKDFVMFQERWVIELARQKWGRTFHEEFTA